MTTSIKKCIKKIIEDGLNGKTKRGEIRKLLKPLATSILEVEDVSSVSIAKKDMKILSKILTQKSILNHKSDDIAAYNGVCLCYILYYNDKHELDLYDDNDFVLKNIVKIIFNEVQLISNKHDDERNLYRCKILKLLCNDTHVVNTILSITDMNNDPILSYKCVETCMDKLVEENLTNSVIFQLKSLVGYFIECYDVIPMTVLHILYRYIVISSDIYSSIIIDHKDILLSSTTEFFRLLFAQNEEESDESMVFPTDFESPFRDPQVIDDLFQQLSQISPSLLTNIVIDIQHYLESESLDIRLRYIKLLGKCYVNAQESSFPTLYISLIDTYLRRFNDIKPEVRIEMCKISSDILKKEVFSDVYKEKVLEYMALKAVDSDAKVRLAAVKSVLNAAIHNINCINSVALHAAAGRCLDKKHDIRISALSGLSILFRDAVGKYWKIGSGVPRDHKMCVFIPTTMLKSASSSPTARIEVLQLFSECILSEKYSSNGRSLVLLGIFASLQVENKTLFEKLLKMNVSANIIMSDLLSSTNKLSEKQNEMKVNSLGSLFPTELYNMSDIKQHISTILHHKNKKIIKYFRQLCDINTRNDDYKSVKHELYRTIRQHNAKSTRKTNDDDDSGGGGGGELINMPFIEKLLALCSCNMINKETMNILMDECIKKLNLPDNCGVGLATDILLMIKAFANMNISLLYRNNDDDDDDIVISYMYKNIFKLLKTTAIDEIKSICLELLSLLSTTTTTSTMKIKKSLRINSYKTYITSLLSSSSSLTNVKYIINILSYLHGNNMDKLWKYIMNEYNDDDNDRMIYIKALSVLIKIDHDNARVYCNDVYDDIYKNILIQYNDNDEYNIELMKVSMKFIGNYLIYCHQDNENMKNHWNFIEKTVKYLVKLCENNGELYENMLEEHENDCDILYLQACKTMIKLSTYSPYRLVIHPLYWSVIIMCIQHDNSDVREEFANSIIKRLRSSKLHYKFVVFLALSATDPAQSVVTFNKSFIEKVIERQRRLYNISVNINKEMMLPECILSDLLYYLAHHPDYEEDDDDSKRYFLKIIDYFLDCLLPKHHQNFTVVMQLLGNLHDCNDGTSSNTKPLHVMIELAIRSLKQRYQNRNWDNPTTNYKNLLKLDSRMYKIRNDASSSTSSKSIDNYIQDNFIAYPNKKSKQRKAKKTPKKRVKRKKNKQEEDDDDEEEVVVKRSTPSRRAKQQRRVIVDDDDDFENMLMTYESYKTNENMNADDDDDDDGGSKRSLDNDDASDSISRNKKMKSKHNTDDEEEEEEETPPLKPITSSKANRKRLKLTRKRRRF